MIEKIMRERRSVRKFKSKAPDRAAIMKLIDIAVSAPSASNKQPWRFFITENKQIINRMATMVTLAADRIAQQIESDYLEMFQNYRSYYDRFSAAPVVIVPVFKPLVLLSNMLGAAIAEQDLTQIRTMEFNSGLVSTSLAIQNILLYAHSCGLGATCMTAPLIATNSLKALLGIPEAWQIACLIAVGYPDEAPPPTSRRSAEMVVRWVE